MGRLVFHMDDVADPGAALSFVIGEFPRPAPPDDRPRKTATTRMLWREDGSLAAAPGREYFEHDEPGLIPHDEWIVLQQAAAEDALDPDASPKRGRRTP